jgi:hypothetical protein
MEAFNIYVYLGNIAYFIINIFEWHIIPRGRRNPDPYDCKQEIFITPTDARKHGIDLEKKGGTQHRYMAWEYNLRWLCFTLVFNLYHKTHFAHLFPKGYDGTKTQETAAAVEC